MEYYITSIENLEIACLTPYLDDEYRDENFVDIDTISNETKTQLLDELLSKMRSDSRLEEVDNCLFTCKKKYLTDVERDYGITMVDAELCGYVL